MDFSFSALYNNKLCTMYFSAYYGIIILTFALCECSINPYKIIFYYLTQLTFTAGNLSTVEIWVYRSKYSHASKQLNNHTQKFSSECILPGCEYCACTPRVYEYNNKMRNIII